MSDPRHDETPPTRAPRRLWLRLVVVLCTLALVACAALGAGAFLVYQHVTQPGVAGEAVKVTIPEGVKGKQAARILADKGLVEHELLFRLALRLDSTHKPIKQGWYALPRGLSPMELLHLLQQGSNRKPDPDEAPPELKVTVPEGLTIAQVAQQFAHPQAFVEAASDPQLVAQLGLHVDTLEGFLFPNTYYFDKPPSEREVVERMLGEFKRQYDGLISTAPLPKGFDQIAVVTIASLVEEEARVADERPKVAAVIYNRLVKKMPLQLDSTLQYALHKYGQRLLYADREVDSPYNTYKHPGLPPGPISSPGLASLRAALQPAEADYLYFVSNADGQTHTFSSTEAEHLRAVNRFRKEIAPQREAIRDR